MLDLTHKEFETVIREAVNLGKKNARAEFVGLIEREICFDALADSDGRCGNHGGKCYELRLLINSVKAKND